MVSNSQSRMFLANDSQTISHPSNSYQMLAFYGILTAPRPPTPTSQIQLPPRYTGIDEIERRCNCNVWRIVKANMKKMIRMMTEYS